MRLTSQILHAYVNKFTFALNKHKYDLFINISNLPDTVYHDAPWKKTFKEIFQFTWALLSDVISCWKAATVISKITIALFLYVKTLIAYCACHLKNGKWKFSNIPKIFNSCYWIWSIYIYIYECICICIRGVIRTKANFWDVDFYYFLKRVYCAILDALLYWPSFLFWVKKQPFWGVRNFYKSSNLVQSLLWMLLPYSRVKI